MALQRKICVVTGTRAEYGLLVLLMKAVQEDPRLKLQIIATGMHLSPEFGLTYREIEKDGFAIDRKIEILLSSDTAVGVSKAIGLGILGFADAFASLAPDLVVLIGDRFEILAAATAALIPRLPIAHIGGGDLTEGAFDDAIRHSITKMAHLHFTTNEQSSAHVRQMGEDPRHVHNFGSPGLDCIAKMKFLDRDALAQELDFAFRKRNILVTYHPETLASSSAEEAFRELATALASLGPDVGIIFTKANADTEGRAINAMIDAFVQATPQARAYASLGQKRYLSLIRQVDVVVGNSSSGVYEVPSLKKPTVNIGDRQKGRLFAASVVNCRCESAEIGRAVAKALALNCSQVANPYAGEGDTARRIKDVLGSVDFSTLIPKHFHQPVP